MMNDVVLWWNDPHVCFVYSACLFIESELFKAQCFRYRCFVSFYVECPYGHLCMDGYITGWQVSCQNYLTLIFVYPVSCWPQPPKIHFALMNSTCLKGPNFLGLKTEPSWSNPVFLWSTPLKSSKNSLGKIKSIKTFNKIHQNIN